MGTHTDIFRGVERACDRDDARAAAREVGRLYAFADALKAANRALNETSYGLRPEFDSYADDLSLGDLDTWAREVKAIADRWQDEIDEAACLTARAQREG